MDRRAVTGHPDDLLSPEHPVGSLQGEIGDRELGSHVELLFGWVLKVFGGPAPALGHCRQLRMSGTVRWHGSDFSGSIVAELDGERVLALTGF